MTSNDRKVGVIGGMGPDATLDFVSRVLAITPAKRDQDHIRMVVEINPKTPSRQAAMCGGGESPGPGIAAMAQRLAAAGAEFLVMPCNLAHAWQSHITEATAIPFVSLVEGSVASALERSGDDSAVGLMTTPGCYAAELYQHAIADAGRAVVVQTPDELGKTMACVERIKAGDRSVEVAATLQKLGQNLITRGAQVLILACTEFPLVLNESMFDVAYVSPTDVLARTTVALAMGDTPLPTRQG